MLPASSAALFRTRSFIPCQKAVIGLVDGIFTRINSFESCSVMQSTFTIDVNQASKALVVPLSAGDRWPDTIS